MPAVRLSRYEFAPVETDECDRIFLDVPPPPTKEVLLRNPDRVVVGEGDTVFTIAWRVYTDLLDREQDIRPTSFYDVICHANDIVDPTEPLEIGRILFIPSIQTIVGDVRVPPPFFFSSGTS